MPNGTVYVEWEWACIYSVTGYSQVIIIPLSLWFRHDWTKNSTLNTPKEKGFFYFHSQRDNCDLTCTAYTQCSVALHQQSPSPWLKVVYAQRKVSLSERCLLHTTLCLVRLPTMFLNRPAVQMQWFAGKSRTSQDYYCWYDKRLEDHHTSVCLSQCHSPVLG